ncbi:BRCA1-A complex subunit Abraxa [Tripterygium wilfordii]|uniref:BRCA1-A complex subunit Abraxa n=1 Tax=Tripterygium wilfordii TaxID=458696 RepID=A0A7J7DWL6_TRIWF|nr:uncharacterized protein LOC119995099 [Tripterygium wilfordii]XP_038697408.1 uncharacterized protein LOC119995099 [Tripterygium wilfordii]KAF5750778.1 BRCA1-A complex subunit Abraxa [Tripterygium wilfordii]
MEHQLQKIAISGPTLTSLLQRFSASPADIDGLLFGRVTLVTPTLTDDSASASSDHPHLIATITSFLSFNSALSFYDPLGNLRLGPNQYQNLLGWFSARRRSALRPSMRELSVSSSLSKSSNYNSAASANDINTSYGNFSPCIFLLVATPVQESLIHTHDYRAYQFVASTSFEAKSVEVVNIGPAFRGHYGNFSPTSPLPVLSCEMRGSSMMMTEEESSRESKEATRDQRQLNKCAEGFEVRRLRQLLGSESTSYTAGLEDMYEKMLAKIESLARQVETSSAKVLEQENLNRKLRYKVIRAGLE